ncbi:ABC transporter permease [Desulforamulus aquiferis]|uniref:ABC transporter permease n=1 Tax=Desulforamulus aquiferis TaxID=1397668 RepID=A0AAW7ZB84_9FIRM|nr:ABC transporter permease [Desulforamulus aquiferis]
MRLKQLIKLILTNISHNKTRTFLTTLGVIVGTATIFLVVAIGKGSEDQVNAQYSRLNVGTIMISAAQRGSVADPLTKDDAAQLMESANIAEAYPVLRGQGDINYTNYSSRSSYQAILPGFQDSNNLVIEQGRALEEEDEEKKSRVAVLGAELAHLLTDGNPSEIVGQSISISGRKFEVIGIFERVGDAGGQGSYDDSAFIAYTVGEKYLLGTRANPTIIVQATGLDTVQAAIDDITFILDETHRIGGSQQFRIFDAGSRLAAAQETARTMSLLLLAVAVVVLIVSGIGIMNVMFVTVKERTKEIGTLKAIGAKRKEILSQFLIEAVIISLVGGVIGVIIGFVTIPMLSYFELPAVASVNGVFLGLVFSVVTGVFFGFYPAYKAADLNPIEALRYE